MKAYLLQKFDYEDLIESKIFLDKDKAKAFYELKRKLGEEWDQHDVKIDESDYKNIKLKKFWEANGRGVWYDDPGDMQVKEMYVLENEDIPKNYHTGEDGGFIDIRVYVYSLISAEDAREKCTKSLTKQVNKVKNEK